MSGAELVKVVLEVGFAQSVINIQAPALEFENRRWVLARNGMIISAAATMLGTETVSRAETRRCYRYRAMAAALRFHQDIRHARNGGGEQDREPEVDQVVIQSASLMPCRIASNR